MKNPIKYDWQKEKIYPYLFQEDLYIKSTIRSKIPLQVPLSETKKKISFLRIKRIIHSVRYRNYFEEKKYFIQNNEFKSKSQKSDTLIIKPIESIFHKSNYEKKKLDNNNLFGFYKKNRYNSIQIALISLEYQWISYNETIVKGKICYNLHTEILLRILRKLFYDISFLHYIRQILHGIRLNILRPKCLIENLEWENLTNFFFNIFTIEFQELFVLEFRKLFSKSKFSNPSINENFSCFYKIEKWKDSKLKIQQSFLFSKTKSNSLYNNDIKAYKYLHTNTSWFLNIQGKELVVNSLHKRCTNYLQNRLGYLHTSNKIELILPGISTYIIGYRIVFNLKEIRVNLLNMYKFLKKSIKIKSVGIFIPFRNINYLLAMYGFCNSKGYPITKLGWTTWSDDLIITRFKDIRDSLIGYYSGAMNQKELSHLQHILHYSCAKTLACKHKTKLRRIWKKYGRNLSVFLIYTSKTISFDILGKGKKTKFNLRKNTRFWNLYFKDPDVLSSSVDKTYDN